MKRHPAAVLAIVGWYLMVPPSFDSTVSLSQWLMIGTFDTAKECESRRIALNDPAFQAALAAAAAKHGWIWDRKALGLSRIEAAQCVASDDPRLKGRQNYADFGSKTAELFRLVDRAIVLANEAMTASTDRQAEIRAELESIVGEIDKLKLRYKN